MTDQDEGPTVAQPGSGLLGAGVVITIAGIILLIIRLVMGAVEPFGIISNVLLILTGVVLAWKPLRLRRART